MTRSPFTPTRDHPHRWCKPLHRTINAAGGIIIIAGMIANPLVEAMLVIFSVIVGIAVSTGLAGRGGTPGNRIAYQASGTPHNHTPDAPDAPAKDTGSDYRPPGVPVDPRWARIASATDMFIATVGVFGLIAIGAEGTDAYKQTQGIPPLLGWLMIGAGGFAAFRVYAHWRATRPRPPRRARAWLHRRATALNPS